MNVLKSYFLCVFFPGLLTLDGYWAAIGKMVVMGVWFTLCPHSSERNSIPRRTWLQVAHRNRVSHLPVWGVRRNPPLPNAHTRIPSAVITSRSHSLPLTSRAARTRSRRISCGFEGKINHITHRPANGARKWTAARTHTRTHACWEGCFPSRCCASWHNRPFILIEMHQSSFWTRCSDYMVCSNPTGDVISRICSAASTPRRNQQNVPFQCSV